MDPTTANASSSGGMGQPTHAEVPTPNEKGAPQVVAVATDTEATSSVAGTGSIQAPVPLAQLPIVPASTVAASAHVAYADDSPLVAADDEVMEKEWVEKAKKIVAETRDDPYSQEKQVSKLQADYIKKRYGKEIKLTSD